MRINLDKIFEKEDLIKSILKRLPELTDAYLRRLPMKDLWEIDRKITWLISSRLALEAYKNEGQGFVPTSRAQGQQVGNLL